MLLSNTLLKASGSGLIKPQDVFKTTTYTGNGSGQTITTGLDMAGKGGLVWTKGRSGSFNNSLVDTIRGRAFSLSSNITSAETTSSAGRDITNFLNNGYSLGIDELASLNSNGNTFVSWSFRRAPKFLDIITYTGDGVAGRQIPHGLGIAPGMIIVKARNTTNNWHVYQRSIGAMEYFNLNLTNAAVTDNNVWNNTEPTSAVFTVGNQTNTNNLGTPFVAYLFAQNSSLIDCGSYIGNSNTPGPIVTCGSGWRPQWLLIKNASVSADWYIFDTVRGFSTGADARLFPNLSQAELNGIDFINPTSTGFQPSINDVSVNTNGQTYIYMAIREPI